MMYIYFHIYIMEKFNKSKIIIPSTIKVNVFTSIQYPKNHKFEHFTHINPIN
jgi:hypothetical protein